jgi:hypothetical protein
VAVLVDVSIGPDGEDVTGTARLIAPIIAAKVVDLPDPRDRSRARGSSATRGRGGLREADVVEARDLLRDEP